MKTDYWDVTDDQVIEKTGQPIAHWHAILTDFGAVERKSNDSVALLQAEHGIPRYWARTLTTNFLKTAGK